MSNETTAGFSFLACRRSRVKKSVFRKVSLNKTANGDCFRSLRFAVYENHTLGVWFKKASAMRKTKNSFCVEWKCGLPTAQTKAKGGHSMSVNDINSLSHTKWNCKYHIVFAPKYRRKVFYKEKRNEVGKILRQLCEWKGVNIVEAEVCPDHVHMLVEIPPKMAV